MASDNVNRVSGDDDDEEPDYMSDDFLKQCVPDVRPGLSHSRVDKRKLDVMTGRKKANKTKKELEEERIKSTEEAMKVPLNEDNKGFRMLQRMGYKPGSSLGRVRDDEEPGDSKQKLTEPIKIDIKQRRGGLGQEKHEEQKLERFLVQGNTDYRIRKHTDAKARQVFNDLKKAQFSCQSLDEDKGIVKPDVKWYWPEVKKKKKKVEDDEEGLLIEESEADAGPEVVVLKKRRTEEASEEESEESEPEDEEDEVIIPDEDKLDTLSTYLRDTYFYCLWCGVKYENSNDMDGSCPGTDKDSH